MDSNASPISIHWGPSSSSQDHHRIISDTFPTQRFTRRTDRDERIITDTQQGPKSIGGIGRTNDYRGGACDGIRANPGLIDDGSNNIPPPGVASDRVDTTPSSGSRPNRTFKVRKKHIPTTNPHLRLFVDKIGSDDNDRNVNSKSNDQPQRRAHERLILQDEQDESDDQLDSKSRFDNEDGPDIESVWKRRRLSYNNSQEQLSHHQGLLRAASSVSGGISPPGSASISRIPNLREPNSEGYRHLFPTEEGGLGPTYNVGDARKYLRSYITYIYPLCPLEICNDSVEDLVFDTLRKSSSAQPQPSPMTVLCVYVMLALGDLVPHLVFFFYAITFSIKLLGARYMHVERAREFFLSAKAQLEYLPEGIYKVMICVSATFR